MKPLEDKYVFPNIKKEVKIIPFIGQHIICHIFDTWVAVEGGYVRVRKEDMDEGDKIKRFGLTVEQASKRFKVPTDRDNIKLMIQKNLFRDKDKI